jgi:hypothetical protein
MTHKNELFGYWFRFWSSRPANPQPAIRLGLLEDDVGSLRFALRDFIQARNAFDAWALDPDMADGPPPLQGHDERQAYALMFHHARIFVVVMRRFARLLEAAHTRSPEYPAPIAEAIRLAWKSSRAFLEQYRLARDAIEHIDGEITGANHRYMNLWNDQLEVVAGTSVAISAPALEVVDRAWRRIVDAVAAPAREEQLRFGRLVLLNILRQRLHTLQEA